jgi:hypothetical protein
MNTKKNIQKNDENEKEIAKLTVPKEPVPVWRAKGKKDKVREIPLPKMEDDHLQRAYFVTQNKELEHFNKLFVFATLREHIEKEANRRGLKLVSLEEVKPQIGDYFVKSRLNDEV